MFGTGTSLELDTPVSFICIIVSDIIAGAVVGIGLETGLGLDTGIGLGTPFTLIFCITLCSSLLVTALGMGGGGVT